MTERDKFLTALREDSTFAFNKLMKRHYAHDDLFNVTEILETLSKNQVHSLWKNLFHLCSLALQSSDFDQEHLQEQELLEALQTLQNLATVAVQFLSLDKPIITNELFQIVTILHGILLSLPENAAKLQNDISKLCECWFVSDFCGKEEIISNTVIYLLARTHLQSPTKADLKRVWDIKNAFHLLDFEDESSDGLKVLLERCLLHPLYLGTDMGKKILVFMFSLHPCIVEYFHHSIKNAIPSCQVAFLDAFSEIYFQAWKEAESACKEKIETFCIQDLMFCAVHAKKELFPKIENMLKFIHKHKSQPNVDGMLYTLYQPILWRALKASNPLVRANASSILIDVFPLIDTSTSVVENDQQRQIQLDAIADLLQDSCPLVRVKAIEGVCKLCFYYWEYIPAVTIKDFFIKMTGELAFDSSSYEVRAAVFKGLMFLINNRLSHPLLKNLMPNLRILIHDQSDKVRHAFLQLLLAIKGIRSIKFWSIVPVEHLLARLEVESSTSCIKIIVKLLVNSYLPSKGDPTSQLTNCAELMWTNRGAARTFFKFAHFSASVKIIANLTLILTNCLLKSMKNPTRQEDCENNATNNESNINACFDKEENSTKENSFSSLHDSDDIQIDFTNEILMTTMLDVLAITWLSIKGKLNKAGNVKLKQKLIETLSKAVPEFLQSFQDSESRAAVFVLASNLPPSPQISRSCLDTLHNLPSDTDSDTFGPVIDYLCATGSAPDVLDHLYKCIKKGLTEPIANQRKVPRSKDKGVKFFPQSSAVKILSWILSQSSTREAILKHKDKCIEVQELLKTSMECIGKILQSNKCAKTQESFQKDKADFMAECFSIFCRIGVHLNGQKDDLFEKGVDIVEEFKYILTWMDQVVLPEIERHGGMIPTVAASRVTESKKRKKNLSFDESDQIVGAFVSRLLEMQLMLTSDVIQLGFGSISFHNCVADFISRLSSHPSSICILPEAMRICRDISQARSSNVEQVNESNDPVIKIVESCFYNIRISKNKFPDVDETQVLSSMKSYFTETVKNRFCTQSVLPSYDVALMRTLLLIAIDGINSFLSENESHGRFDGLGDLPIVSSFIITVLLRSKQFQRSLFEELLFIATEGKSTEKLKISSLVFLVDLFIRTSMKNNVDELLMRTVDELEKKFAEALVKEGNNATDCESFPSDVLALLEELVKKRAENPG